MKPRISTVVAIGSDQQHNRVIGDGNGLLWHIPDDLRRFKEITMGHPVIMGRKTFESILAILGKPLPGRTNIVITRDTVWSHEGAVAAHSLDEAIAMAAEEDQEEIFIGGGGQVYNEALPYIERLYLTLIDDQKEGDAFFPAYEDIFTKKVFEEEREHNGLRYRWVTLDRPSSTEDPS